MLRFRSDSGAAIGICSRQGLGKLRHLDTQTLWVQQAVRTRRLELRKELGEENPADLFTKHSLSRARLEKLVALHGCRYAGGRAESAPQVRKGESNKFTLADAGLHVTEDAGPEPYMPHLSCSRRVLEERFPPLEVTSDEGLDDSPEQVATAQDAVFQYGLGIARRIEDDAKRRGRRRRATTIPVSPTASSHTTPTTPTTTPPKARTTTTPQQQKHQTLATCRESNPFAQIEAFPHDTPT